MRKDAAATEAAAGEAAIQIENVSRHYSMGESSIRAVDNVSLTIPNGEFLALLGSSGSVTVTVPIVAPAALLTRSPS